MIGEAHRDFYVFGGGGAHVLYLEFQDGLLAGADIRDAGRHAEVGAQLLPRVSGLRFRQTPVLVHGVEAGDQGPCKADRSDYADE